LNPSKKGKERAKKKQERGRERREERSNGEDSETLKIH